MSSAEEITAELRRRLPKRSEGDQILADLLEWAGYMVLDLGDGPGAIPPWVRAKEYMKRVRDREDAGAE